jgi:signal transduction histidine kinase
MILSIEDKGNDFDTKRKKNIRLFGLLRVQKQAALINGLFKIRSKPGKGIKIELIVPVIF